MSAIKGGPPRFKKSVKATITRSRKPFAPLVVLSSSCGQRAKESPCTHSAMIHTLKLKTAQPFCISYSPTHSCLLRKICPYTIACCKGHRKDTSLSYSLPMMHTTSLPSIPSLILAFSNVFNLPQNSSSIHRDVTKVKSLSCRASKENVTFSL